MREISAETALELASQKQADCRCFLQIGAPGFEPGTSCSQSRRANQAAPRPVPAMLPAGSGNMGAVWLIDRMDAAVGDGIDAAVKARHRHRLYGLGWQRAI